MSHDVRVNDALYAALRADADALGESVNSLVTMLLCEGMHTARARRYSPFQLPEGYGWDVFGKPYTAETTTPAETASVTPIRKARRSSR